MRMHYLQEFLVLVRYMNFSTAAKYLNLTQSALSKHIASLENEFDSVFFNRSYQNIELTGQGRAFCVDAEEMLKQYKLAQAHMKSIRLEVRLAGAVDDAATFKLITAAKTSLIETDPGFELSLNSNPVQPLAELLIANRIDLYIDIALDDDDVASSLETCILTSVPLVAIVHREHPLVLRESVSVADLANQTIMCPTGSISSKRGAEAIASVFERYGIAPDNSIFFANSIKDFPFTSIGDKVLVTPRSNFSKQLFPNIMQDYRSLPFEEADAVFPYRLAWRKDESDRQVLAFRDMLIFVAEQMYPAAAVSVAP